MTGFVLDTGDFDNATGDNAGYAARKKSTKGSSLVTMLAEMSWDLGNSFKGASAEIYRMQCTKTLRFSASSRRVAGHIVLAQSRGVQVDGGGERGRGVLRVLFED